MKRLKTEHIIVHCSATPPSLDIGAEVIRVWHTLPEPKGRGWSDIGYHYVIKRNGEVEIGRRVDEVGAHTKGYNQNSIAICLVGGIDERGATTDNFTPAQLESLFLLILELLRHYPGCAVSGHRDFSPDLNRDGKIEPNEWIKDCPSFDVKAWWKAQTFLLQKASESAA